MGGFDEAGFAKVGRAIEIGAPVDGMEAELGLKVSAPVLGWLSILGGMELKARKDEGAYTASAAFSVGIEAGVGKGAAKAVAGTGPSGVVQPPASFCDDSSNSTPASYHVAGSGVFCAASRNVW